jgi:hypothetical protein
MIAPTIDKVGENKERHYVNYVKSRLKKNVTFGQDKIFLVDFGANGNFINCETAFDQNSMAPVTDSQVFLPDESGAVSEAIGTFCGEKAHLLPSFDKSLLCSEFFTNQNCAVLTIEDNLYVLRLDSKVLEFLSNLILNSKLTEDMILNIERENGLYLTTEKAIRKAFNKSIRAGPEKPIQVGSKIPIQVGSEIPIQIGTLPIQIGSLPIQIGSFPTQIGNVASKKSKKLSSNASYFTAKLSDVEELVRFWHVNLGHMSK